jgi:hypothetical protein
MHWLYLLFALVAMVLAIKTSSTGLMLLGLLASLVLIVLWLVGLYSARMAGRSRDPSAMIDPAELRRLREQAEARKAANNPDAPAP